MKKLLIIALIGLSSCGTMRLATPTTTVNHYQPNKEVSRKEVKKKRAEWIAVVVVILIQMNAKYLIKS